MNDERFSELLPWYVNGSIAASDRAWVDRYLTEHPEARSELDWFESLQERIHEAMPTIPASIGLSRVMAKVRADQPTLAQRFSNLLAGFAPRPALALSLLGVVVIQGGVIIGMLRGEQQAVEMRAANPIAVQEGPLVKVNFAPDARESDIRMLLVSVQGTLAGGPGQLGDYYVRVPAGKEAQAAAKLKGVAIVQAAELAPGLPPHD